MAEFLVAGALYRHADPAKRARASYEPGDLIEARPDGYIWNHAEERPPRFYVVRVPGMSLALAQALCREDRPDPDQPARTRRQHQLDRTLLTTSARDALDLTGSVTITRTALTSATRDKTALLSPARG